MAALTLVISVLAVIFYRAAPANTPAANVSIATEEQAPSSPALTETTLPTTPSATATRHQPDTETQSVNAPGELPPISPEVAAEIQRLSIQNSDGLVEEKHADGSVSMDLQGHFQSVTAAAIGADGKLVIRHGEEFLKNVK